MLRVLDLFSGIGGFSLGLERTGGFRTVAFCESDPFCRRVLARHWPEVPRYDDVRTLIADRLAADGIAVDVVTGGFPCQDISFAGAGAGLGGARSGLWFEMLRVIAETRPRYVIAENVSALRSRGLDVVLGGLASVGYDAEWHCIPAAAVGAPHRRDRVWIIAHRNANSIDESTFSEIFNWAHSKSSGDRADVADASWERGATGREAGDLVGSARAREEYGAERQWHGHAVDYRRADVAHAACSGQPDIRWRSSDAGFTGVGAALRSGLNGGAEHPWLAEPDVGRVADGVSARVDRLRCLGNAVVPQIPELIGRAILVVEQVIA